ncbi:hypothetical protein [Massilia sp. BKSP1R2A-1]|jgi:hypothetical protein|uniref:hypothetical protein n=1 Tax=Massilia sp. BKSP1R2A-1 TaxID=3422595 RepID=UPI003D342F16
MTPKHPNRRLRAAALALAAAMALAACGGSNDRVHEPGPGGGTTPPPPPPVAGDSFFALVVARVASLLDSDEPVAIDAVTATTPETTEPEPLPAT